ncbi:Histone-lysine N-methyltransferase, H3 lysine-79 specific [Saguinus oedipus]|uniref:Histone-lysine N-methyltransferase, H3 lysine-79 specific n=1 Tax=Saguinus oedipus TaxID=9490 RepID=A0ABQ9TQN3_SAGOE|nr:Histone-lysine N-methyltransferase, H3 lysine-79 specific [Saguinus oedipus]
MSFPAGFSYGGSLAIGGTLAGSPASLAPGAEPAALDESSSSGSLFATVGSRSSTPQHPLLLAQPRNSRPASPAHQLSSSPRLGGAAHGPLPEASKGDLPSDSGFSDPESEAKRRIVFTIATGAGGTRQSPSSKHSPLTASARGDCVPSHGQDSRKRGRRKRASTGTPSLTAGVSPKRRALTSVAGLFTQPSGSPLNLNSMVSNINQPLEITAISSPETSLKSSPVPYQDHDQPPVLKKERPLSQTNGAHYSPLTSDEEPGSEDEPSSARQVQGPGVPARTVPLWRNGIGSQGPADSPGLTPGGCVDPLRPGCCCLSPVSPLPAVRLLLTHLPARCVVSCVRPTLGALGFWNCFREALTAAQGLRLLVLRPRLAPRLSSLPGGSVPGRRPAPAGEPVNSSKWKSTFSPISDIGLAKAADSPLQVGPTLSQSSLFAFRPALEETPADAKLAAHPRKGFPGSLSGADGLSPSTNPANGCTFGGGLAAELSSHSFSDGASLPNKGPEAAGLSSPLGFPSQRTKEASDANPFLSKRQLDGLAGLKGEGGRGKEVGEGGLPLCGPADKTPLPPGKAAKARDRELDLKNGHNLFISAAAVPPGGLLSGPGLAPAASSAGSAGSSAQTHRPFLGPFPPGPQFALGPMALQANLGSVAGSSVLQSLFSSVPAAAGLVHVSSAATRLTNSHAMGSFSGVAGSTVGEGHGVQGHQGIPFSRGGHLLGVAARALARLWELVLGVFNHAVPSASAHPFGARVGRGAACGSATLGPSPLQAAASASASSLQAPASVETRPPPPPPPPPLPPPAHLGRPPAGPPVLHALPPNATLPPPPTLLASNPELLQSLASLPPNQAFLPPASAASLPPANASLSIKLTSLPHKGARPSFTVHHQPLPRLALAQAAPGIPQASTTGPSAVWVSLGMPPPYATHLSGVKPR